MLKLNVPFTTKDEVLPLIEAGADELYCGYLDKQWAKEFTPLEFERKGRGSNFTDFNELTRAVELAHKNNTPAYLAINGLYVSSQYGLLLKIIRKLGSVGFDGFIIADLGLLLTLREMGFKQKMHISTGGTVFNSEASSFYKDLGASRIVLDRQTSLEAMRSLSGKNPDLDFEVFILNTLCVYIDGFCTFMHGYGRDSEEDIAAGNNDIKIIAAYALASGDACCLKYSVAAYDADFKKKIKAERKIRPTFFKQLSDGIECGACAIYDIDRAGIKVIKIVGRQFVPEKRLGDTKFIRGVLNILRDNSGMSKADFVTRAQRLYRDNYKYDLPCRGNNCYYPEVLKFKR